MERFLGKITGVGVRLPLSSKNFQKSRKKFIKRHEKCLRSIKIYDIIRVQKSKEKRL